VSVVVTTLDGPLAAFREAEIRLLTDIATALAEMGDTAQEDRKRLLEVAQDLREMFFLVVIIGEFNAGKSSFINALLGDQLLPVGVTPTTETIELIRYGDVPNRKPSVREDGIREWMHPNTGAPGVALVDTPGTGSVFHKHEKTAKAFLHRSDLVIFVISAKRALAETERLYLELARDYGKKIILVVNQIDLLSPQERTEVRRFVERQVEELLDLRPLIFMVSSKEALNALRNGTAEGGGIDAVRAHLRGVLSEAPPTKQKLIAQLDMAERIASKYAEMVNGRADLVSADTAKVRDVQSELEQQSLGLNAQLKNARADIDTVFEGLRRRGLSFINENLSIRRLGRGTNREALQAEFQDVVIGRALRDINDASGDYVNALIDNSRLYWRGVIDRLNQLRDLVEQELTGLDASVYAEQREALQEAIRIAEAELKSYSSGRVIGEMEDLFRNNMNGFTASAAAAIIGIIVTVLAIAAPGGVIGASVIYASATVAFVIGAPIAAIGSIAAIRYYRRVTADTKRDFNQRVDQLEATYHAALDDLTQRERNRLTQYGKQVLTPIFSRLEVLAQRYALQQNTLQKLIEQIETLQRGIEESYPA
jgi:small GTP-binding protein